MSQSASREPEDDEDFVDDDVVLEPDDAPEPSPDDDSPDDPWNEEVFRQLDLLQNSRRSWVQSLIILVVTLVLFGAAQLVQKSAENLAWLVAVLLIHESGHFAGMKLFGYRDVRMFFLPFFGAAVSGRAHNVPGWQAAIVILLGPLPGIAIGVVLGIVALVFRMDSLRSTAMLFAALNGFNLLPFMPLDGGRLLQLTLFGRQRHLEALFQAITGLLLALLGFVGGGWFLGLVGIMMLIGSGPVFRISTVARQTLAELGDGWKAPDDYEHIPDGVARQILQGVRSRFPQNKNAKVAATMIRQVWDRMLVNPPGLAATLALLSVYAVGLICTLVIVVALAVAGMKHDHVVPPGRDKQLLAQPQLDFADGSVTHQGSAFFVHAPHGETAAVTASHYLDQTGPALLHVWLLSVTAAEPTPLADSTVGWGSPGIGGLRGANEVTDLRDDRILLPVTVDERLVHVLDLDDRPGPTVDERVWFPDKQQSEPGGFRLIEGTVLQIEKRFILVRLDTALQMQSQSGSPVISQVNGKVLGLLGGATDEPGSTLLFLNPATELRKALDDTWRPILSTVVGKSQKRVESAPQLDEKSSGREK
jgi:Zn-dependent protease